MEIFASGVVLVWVSLLVLVLVLVVAAWLIAEVEAWVPVVAASLIAVVVAWVLVVVAVLIAVLLVLVELEVEVGEVAAAIDPIGCHFRSGSQQPVSFQDQPWM